MKLNNSTFTSKENYRSFSTLNKYQSKCHAHISSMRYYSSEGKEHGCNTPDDGLVMRNLNKKNLKPSPSNNFSKDLEPSETPHTSKLQNEKQIYESNTIGTKLKTLEKSSSTPILKLEIRGISIDETSSSHLQRTWSSHSHSGTMSVGNAISNSSDRSPSDLKYAKYKMPYIEIKPSINVKYEGNNSENIASICDMKNTSSLNISEERPYLTVKECPTKSISDRDDSGSLVYNLEGTMEIPENSKQKSSLKFPNRKQDTGNKINFYTEIKLNLTKKEKSSPNQKCIKTPHFYRIKEQSAEIKNRQKINELNKEEFPNESNSVCLKNTTHFPIKSNEPKIKMHKETSQEFVEMKNKTTEKDPLPQNENPKLKPKDVFPNVKYLSETNVFKCEKSEKEHILSKSSHSNKSLIKSGSCSHKECLQNTPNNQIAEDKIELLPPAQFTDKKKKKDKKKNFKYHHECLVTTRGYSKQLVDLKRNKIDSSYSHKAKSLQATQSCMKSQNHIPILQKSEQSPKVQKINNIQLRSEEPQTIYQSSVVTFKTSKKKGSYEQIKLSKPILKKHVLKEKLFLSQRETRDLSKCENVNLNETDKEEKNNLQFEIQHKTKLISSFKEIEMFKNKLQSPEVQKQQTTSEKKTDNNSVCKQSNDKKTKSENFSSKLIKQESMAIDIQEQPQAIQAKSTMINANQQPSLIQEEAKESVLEENLKIEKAKYASMKKKQINYKKNNLKENKIINNETTTENEPRSVNNVSSENDELCIQQNKGYCNSNIQPYINSAHPIKFECQENTEKLKSLNQPVTINTVPENIEDNNKNKNVSKQVVKEIHDKKSTPYVPIKMTEIIHNNTKCNLTEEKIKLCGESGKFSKNELQFKSHESEVQPKELESKTEENKTRSGENLQSELEKRKNVIPDYVTKNECKENASQCFLGKLSQYSSLLQDKLKAEEAKLKNNEIVTFLPKEETYREFSEIQSDETILISKTEATLEDSQLPNITHINSIPSQDASFNETEFKRHEQQIENKNSDKFSSLKHSNMYEISYNITDQFATSHFNDSLMHSTSDIIYKMAEPDVLMDGSKTDCSNIYPMSFHNMTKSLYEKSTRCSSCYSHDTRIGKSQQLNLDKQSSNNSQSGKCNYPGPSAYIHECLKSSQVIKPQLYENPRRANSDVDKRGYCEYSKSSEDNFYKCGTSKYKHESLKSSQNHKILSENKRRDKSNIGKASTCTESKIKLDKIEKHETTVPKEKLGPLKIEQKNRKFPQEIRTKLCKIEVTPNIKKPDRYNQSNNEINNILEIFKTRGHKVNDCKNERPDIKGVKSCNKLNKRESKYTHECLKVSQKIKPKLCDKIKSKQLPLSKSHNIKSKSEEVKSKTCKTSGAKKNYTVEEVECNLTREELCILCKSLLKKYGDKTTLNTCKEEKLQSTKGSKEAKSFEESKVETTEGKKKQPPRSSPMENLRQGFNCKVFFQSLKEGINLKILKEGIKNAVNWQQIKKAVRENIKFGEIVEGFKKGFKLKGLLIGLKNSLKLGNLGKAIKEGINCKRISDGIKGSIDVKKIKQAIQDLYKNMKCKLKNMSEKLKKKREESKRKKPPPKLGKCKKKKDKFKKDKTLPKVKQCKQSPKPSCDKSESGKMNFATEPLDFIMGNKNIKYTTSPFEVIFHVSKATYTKQATPPDEPDNQNKIESNEELVKMKPIHKYRNILTELKPNDSLSQGSGQNMKPLQENVRSQNGKLSQENAQSQNKQLPQGTFQSQSAQLLQESQGNGQNMKPLQENVRSQDGKRSQENAQSQNRQLPQGTFQSQSSELLQETQGSGQNVKPLQENVRSQKVEQSQKVQRSQANVQSQNVQPSQRGFQPQNLQLSQSTIQSQNAQGNAHSQNDKQLLERSHMQNSKSLQGNPQPKNVQSSERSPHPHSIPNLSKIQGTPAPQYVVALQQTQPQQCTVDPIQDTYQQSTQQPICAQYVLVPIMHIQPIPNPTVTQTSQQPYQFAIPKPSPDQVTEESSQQPQMQEVNPSSPHYDSTKVRALDSSNHPSAPPETSNETVSIKNSITQPSTKQQQIILPQNPYPILPQTPQQINITCPPEASATKASISLPVSQQDSASESPTMNPHNPVNISPSPCNVESSPCTTDSPNSQITSSHSSVTRPSLNHSPQIEASASQTVGSPSVIPKSELQQQISSHSFPSPHSNPVQIASSQSSPVNTVQEQPSISSPELVNPPQAQKVQTQVSVPIETSPLPQSTDSHPIQRMNIVSDLQQSQNMVPYSQPSNSKPENTLQSTKIPGSPISQNSFHPTNRPSSASSQIPVPPAGLGLSQPSSPFKHSSSESSSSSTAHTSVSRPKEAIPPTQIPSSKLSQKYKLFSSHPTSFETKTPQSFAHYIHNSGSGQHNSSLSPYHFTISSPPESDGSANKSPPSSHPPAKDSETLSTRSQSSVSSPSGTICLPFNRMNPSIAHYIFGLKPLQKKPPLSYFQTSLSPYYLTKLESTPSSTQSLRRADKKSLFPTESSTLKPSQMSASVFSYLPSARITNSLSPYKFPLSLSSLKPNTLQFNSSDSMNSSFPCSSMSPSMSHYVPHPPITPALPHNMHLSKSVHSQPEIIPEPTIQGKAYDFKENLSQAPKPIELIKPSQVTNQEPTTPVSLCLTELEGKHSKQDILNNKPFVKEPVIPTQGPNDSQLSASNDKRSRELSHTESENYKVEASRKLREAVRAEAMRHHSKEDGIKDSSKDDIVISEPILKNRVRKKRKLIQETIDKESSEISKLNAANHILKALVSFYESKMQQIKNQINTDREVINESKENIPTDKEKKQKEIDNKKLEVNDGNMKYLKDGFKSDPSKLCIGNDNQGNSKDNFESDISKISPNKEPIKNRTDKLSNHPFTKVPVNLQTVNNDDKLKPEFLKTALKNVEDKFKSDFCSISSKKDEVKSPEGSSMSDSLNTNNIKKNTESVEDELQCKSSMNKEVVKTVEDKLNSGSSKIPILKEPVKPVEEKLKSEPRGHLVSDKNVKIEAQKHNVIDTLKTVGKSHTIDNTLTSDMEPDTKPHKNENVKTIKNDMPSESNSQFNSSDIKIQGISETDSKADKQKTENQLIKGGRKRDLNIKLNSEIPQKKIKNEITTEKSEDKNMTNLKTEKKNMNEVKTDFKKQKIKALEQSKLTSSIQRQLRHDNKRDNESKKNSKSKGNATESNKLKSTEINPDKDKGNSNTVAQTTGTEIGKLKCKNLGNITKENVSKKRMEERTNMKNNENGNTKQRIITPEDIKNTEKAKLQTKQKNVDRNNTDSKIEELKKLKQMTQQHESQKELMKEILKLLNKQNTLNQTNTETAKQEAIPPSKLKSESTKYINKTDTLSKKKAVSAINLKNEERINDTKVNTNTQNNAREIKSKTNMQRVTYSLPNLPKLKEDTLVISEKNKISENTEMQLYDTNYSIKLEGPTKIKQNKLKTKRKNLVILDDNNNKQFDTKCIQENRLKTEEWLNTVHDKLKNRYMDDAAKNELKSFRNDTLTLKTEHQTAEDMLKKEIDKYALDDKGHSEILKNSDDHKLTGQVQSDTKDKVKNQSYDDISPVTKAMVQLNKNVFEKLLISEELSNISKSGSSEKIRLVIHEKPDDAKAIKEPIDPDSKKTPIKEPEKPHGPRPSIINPPRPGSSTLGSQVSSASTDEVAEDKSRKGRRPGGRPQSSTSGDPELKGLSYHFNSQTIRGRANIAKITYALLGLGFIYYLLKPKPKPPPGVLPKD